MEVVDLSKKREEKSKKYNITHDGVLYRFDISACRTGYDIIYYKEYTIALEELSFFLPPEAAKQSHKIIQVHVELKWYEKPFMTLREKIEVVAKTTKGILEKDLKRLDETKKLKEEIGI